MEIGQVAGVDRKAGYKDMADMEKSKLIENIEVIEPNEDRRAIILRLLNGESVPSVARAFGMSKNTPAAILLRYKIRANLYFEIVNSEHIIPNEIADLIKSGKTLKEIQNKTNSSLARIDNQMKKALNTTRIDGDKLQALREEKCLTQQELAEKTGVPKRVIIRYEKGGATLNTDYIFRLSYVFDIPVETLLCKV